MLPPSELFLAHNVVANLERNSSQDSAITCRFRPDSYGGQNLQSSGSVKMPVIPSYGSFSGLNPSGQNSKESDLSGSKSCVVKVKDDSLNKDLKKADKTINSNK